MGWRKTVDCSATKDYFGVEANAFEGRQGVVWVTVIICVEKLLEPLEEFEIVLETTFDQFVHRYYLYNSRGYQNILRKKWQYWVEILSQTSNLFFCFCFCFKKSKLPLKRPLTTDIICTVHKSEFIKIYWEKVNILLGWNHFTGYLYLKFG